MKRSEHHPKSAAEVAAAIRVVPDRSRGRWLHVQREHYHSLTRLLERDYELDIDEVLRGVVAGDPKAKKQACQMLRDATLHEFVPLILEGTWPKRAAPQQPGTHAYVVDYLVAAMQHDGAFAKGERVQYLNKILGRLRKPDFGYPDTGESVFFSEQERECLREHVLSILNTASRRRQQKIEAKLRKDLLGRR